LLLLTLLAHQIITMPDVVCLFVILGQCVLLVDAPNDHGWLRAVGAAVIVALLALTKFTLLMYAAVAIGVAAIYLIVRGERVTGLAAIGGFGVALAVFFAVLGQSPANLPGYLYGSWQVASGYTEAMAIDGSPVEIWLAAALVAFLAACLIGSSQSLRRGKLATLTVLILAALFLMWKNGFVRHDHHSFGFFALCFLLVIVIPAVSPTHNRRAPWRFAMLTAVCVLSIIGMEMALTTLDPTRNHNPLVRLAEAAGHAQIAAESVAHPWRTKARLDQDFSELAAAYEIPRIKAAVRDRPIDIIAHQQALVLINGLNWRPRPAFQSYYTYTPHLSALNAQFFRAPGGPDFVIFRFETIDQRLPTLDDGAVLFELCRHYRPVLIEKGYLLLQRIPAPVPPSDIESAVCEREITLNEMVFLAEDPTKVSFEMRLTKRGRLLNLVHKLPPLHLNFLMEEGCVRSYRFVPGMAATGVLVNPLLETNHDFVGLFGGRGGRQVKAFWITLAPEHEGYYQTCLRMRLQTLPQLIEPRMTAAELDQIRYPKFQAFPNEVRSGSFVTVEGNGKDDVVIVHSPGEMTFAIPLGARRLTGRFGIMPAAYEQGDTDGVLFAVDYFPPGGRVQTLYQRYLDPRAEPEDRGMQRLNVRLPPSGLGHLKLRTANLIDRSSSWDWSYWSEIQLN
jgi:hypothetical protein